MNNPQPARDGAQVRDGDQVLHRRLYIAKPVDGDELVRTVADTVRGRSKAAAGGESSSPSTETAANGTASAQPASAASPADPGRPASPPLYSTLDTTDPDFREIALEFAERLQEKLHAMQRAYDAAERLVRETIPHEPSTIPHAP